MQYVLTCLLQTLPTRTCVKPWTISYLRKTNNCMHGEWNVLQILFCAADFSQQQNFNAELRSLENSAFTVILDNFKERGNVYFSLHQKGRDTDTILLQQQSSGSVKSLNISDLRKTLNSRIVKIPFSKQKTYSIFSRKKSVARIRSSRSDFKADDAGRWVNCVPAPLLTVNFWSRNLPCGGYSTTEVALPKKGKWLHRGMRWSAPPTLTGNWLVS